MGIVDAQLACKGWPFSGAGELYMESNYGFAATVLSLATNVGATSVVAYKAWYVAYTHMRPLTYSRF